MITLMPLLYYSDIDHQQMAEDCNLTVSTVADVICWSSSDWVPFDFIVRIMAYYNLSVRDTFFWYPDKGALMKHHKWEKKMAGRWDRYRRQRILEELTATKQNWSLSFKLEVINEYYTTDITMRELSEKYEVPREKIKGWIFKNYQV